MREVRQPPVTSEIATGQSRQARTPESDYYNVLEARLRTLLPEEYQDSYEDVQPISMGSASLIYAPDGQVAWNRIWGSFCDLAMAGGPPHRGTLLEPATEAEVYGHRERYSAVVAEICRGVKMVTGLDAQRAAVPGWLRVDCPTSAMAGWLCRAITMENVSAHTDRNALFLPAGPHFRVDKEIKNVVTSIAKTCHYWSRHTSETQQLAVAQLLRQMDAEAILLQAPLSLRETDVLAVQRLQIAIATVVPNQARFLPCHWRHSGWFSIDILSDRSAIWVMRLMVANNVACRREGPFVCVPVNPHTDPTGQRIVARYKHVYEIAASLGIV